GVALVSPSVEFGPPQRQSRYGLHTGIASDASCSSNGLLTGDDHHARRRVLEDVVDGLAEDRLLRPFAARSAEYDDLRLAPLRLADDRAAGASGTQQPPDHVDTVELADRDGRVERLVRGGLSLRQLGIERPRHRPDDYADRR